MEKSRLSVLVPTYNCRTRIDRHLASMATWADLADEIIVVDSRSNDGTLEAIRAGLRHPNLRIIERDRGLYQSWNEGIAATTGDWIYISTIGDTIEREHLLHLRELGERAMADIIISSPRFVDEDGSPHADLNWPPAKIIQLSKLNSPFVLSQTAAAHLSLIHCPSCILGSSASNLYRARSLRGLPFPSDFRGAGDTVWMMRNSLTLRVCLTPREGSSFCVHPKDMHMTEEEEEAFAQSFVRERKSLAEQIEQLGHSGRWPEVKLADDTFLYNNTRQHLQRRRAVWSKTWPWPAKASFWLGLTAAYLLQRVRLSWRRRLILSQLTQTKLAFEKHFQPLT